MLDKNSETVIKITNLNKEYKMFHKKMDRLLETVLPKYEKHDSFKALNNFNLEIGKGEVLGILGKNGAGKSTLLKMITGVVTPTSGTIEVNGKISSLLELGTAFNPELTGVENIYQHGQVMGLTNEQIEAKKQEIIDFADIGEHLYQPVKTYSSGMFARLAFACAINVDPDILIVDEVLSVGDMAFQLKCFKKFEQFKKKNKTILFVTHSITDILKNCNRTIIIDSGNKIFDGGVKEGVDKYKKIIVGLDEGEREKKLENEKNRIEKSKKQAKDTTWKEHLNENPNLVEYGNGKADVIDYGIFDENGNYTSILENDKEYTLKSKVHFNERISEPIFTLTIKDFNGLEITGTNTMYERIASGTFEAGDEVEVSFKETFRLAPGKYTLSFSCTHFTETGELEALSRKYDALLIEVLSMKECVGFVRIDPKVEIKKVFEK